jgi:hypothetical protein
VPAASCSRPDAATERPGWRRSAARHPPRHPRHRLAAPLRLATLGKLAAAAAPGKPLKLADFPATKDGDLARKICQAWAGLRGQYYSRVKSDTSSQLSQWFSGPDWTTVHADGLQLTADRAYIHLGASLGVAMAGSAASAKTGQAVDRACSSGT